MSNQNYVLVIDAIQKPLNPCTPGVARNLLKAGKAAVFRRYPFVIILKKVVDAEPEPMQLKLDPGSKTTGIALLQKQALVFGAELSHRGQQIKYALLTRQSLRRGRRARKTRYRQARFLNRTRKKGWLAPSLQHRVNTVMTWVNRFRKYAPIAGISQELVRFDLQKLENPEISGIEYQQGELAGYEVREYLLEKWDRQCAYCSAKDIPLQVEHIKAKANGGTNRISNLTVACKKCNLKKGTQELENFLKKKPEILKKILSKAKKPLKDATAVNATRWALFNALKQTGLSVEVSSGGKTKFNRCRLLLPKHHYIDAACVGNIDSLDIKTSQPLLIKATGHGTRQMCGTDKHGFPSRHRQRQQIHYGFQTGNIVKAVVTTGKKAGLHVGRVLCRATGSFDISIKTGRVAGINQRFCATVHQKDGYSYGF